MFDFTIDAKDGFHIVALKGRLDGLSAPALREKLDKLVLRGVTNIVADFSEVSYVSSSGLRAFLAVQKQLRSVNGQIILLHISNFAADVFRMSGFDKLFKTVSNEEEISAVFRGQDRKEEVSFISNGISFRTLKLEGSKGLLSFFGTNKKLSNSYYTEDDVIDVNAGSMSFGTGLATIGDDFEEYKSLFGEAVILDGNFFYYPAIKQPVADCILGAERDSNLEYRFLHGFGFDGDISHLLSFDLDKGSVNLTDLVSAAGDASGFKRFGIVLLAECGGLWGMNLKRVPLLEFSPNNGKDIFDSTNFNNWMSFPIDPTDLGSVVAATGIVVKDRAELKETYLCELPECSDFHVHGVVLSKKPFSSELRGFRKELRRVLQSFEAKKVQHILGRSTFRRGVVAIIGLEV